MTDTPLPRPDSNDHLQRHAMQQASGSCVEVITDLHDMLRILLRLQQSHCRFTAQLDNEDQLYSSLLLEVDDQKKNLLFDHPKPQLEHKILAQADCLHIRGSYLGIATWFNTPASRVTSNKRGLSVPLPDQLHHQQRRSCFRVEFDTEHRPSLEIHLEARHLSLPARLIDLSAGGCAIQIPRLFSTPLLHGENCMIRNMQIDHNVHIQAHAKLRNPITQHKSSSTRCGIEFLSLEPADRKKLDRFIARRQRECIRQLSEQSG